MLHLQAGALYDTNLRILLFSLLLTWILELGRRGTDNLLSPSKQPTEVPE